MSRYLAVGFIVFFLIGALAGCGGEQGAGPAGPGAPGPVEVTAVTLKAQPVELERELPGRTSAYVVAEVRPQVTGIIEARLFEEGSDVEAGQPLYQLEDATYRADVASAEAALARSEAALEQARLQAERAERLIRSDSISQRDYDDAIAARNLAEADAGVARAELARSRVMLGYTRITAPIAGYISKSNVTQGALVTANQEQALATVRQLDPIYVDLTQSSAELLELRRMLTKGEARAAEGTPVTILLEDGSRYPHDGELTFSDVAVDPSTGSYDLRVVFPNPDGLLMPGMYVRAIVRSAVLEEGLLVPQKGVTRNPKGDATAMVIASDGTAERRAVQLSRTIGDQWLVAGGLVEGDRVIVEGLQRVQPGAQVQATEAGAAQNAEQ